ncbi:hypothetical protein [Reyranella sp.]|uniref:hypothetical protein n=1 Tax=Reyranella sp. TaxID=1929291 RepID=UPI003D09E712
MVKRPIFAGLALAATLGACSSSRGPSVAYTTPGWYLERPRLLLVSGPEIFAGPMTYEACEAKRVEFETSVRMLCINEKMKPGPFGPYTSTPPATLQKEPL